MVNNMYPFELKGFRDPGPAPSDFSDRHLVSMPLKEWQNSYRLLNNTHQSWKLTRPVSQKTRMRRFMESTAMKTLSEAFHEKTGNEITSYSLEELIRHSRIRCCGHDLDAVIHENSKIIIFIGAYPWISELKAWMQENPKAL